MKQRHHTPEQVIRKLAEGDKLLAQGKTVEEVVQTRHDEEDDGDVEVARCHQDRRRAGRDQPGGGEHVSGDRGVGCPQVRFVIHIVNRRR